MARAVPSMPRWAGVLLVVRLAPIPGQAAPFRPADVPVRATLDVAETTAPPARPSSTGGEAPASVRSCLGPDGAGYSVGWQMVLDGQKVRCVVGPHWEPVRTAPERPSMDADRMIRDALRAAPPPPLRCDALLHSRESSLSLPRLAPGDRRLLVFWTPTCASCKPLLREVAALAAKAPASLSVVGVVQAADPELEPPGEWRVQRVKDILKLLGADFPTCVHGSASQSRAWQAEGVPLLVVVSGDEVREVALGLEAGRQLITTLSRETEARER